MTARAKRHASRGFTLVELLVAMTAGLIVTLAIVGLSREATFSFHEEMRTAAAEMSTRVGIERLKSDLQRAGYMATGNVQKDIHIPLDPRNTEKVSGSAAALLLGLAGVNYHPGGSATATPLSTAGGNAFSPDSIDIAGNFTSSDQYVITRIVAGGGGCTGPRLYLSMDSAATYRVLATADPDATLKGIFQPVKEQKFLIRLADDLGRQEFVWGCKAQTAGVVGGAAYVDLDASNNYLETAYGFVDGRITVNPVQTVRWELRALNSDDAKYGAIATDPGNDGGTSTKYNLVRSYLDESGVPFNTGAEVVAEYAVDLKFAFTVDLGDYTTTSPTPQLQSYAFGAAENSTVANGNGAGTSPQRIRGVRVRFSTRGAVADRIDDQRLPSNAYTIRYCLKQSGCTSGSRDWARVRTMTTEVSLPNQARAFY
jgi:prepilin-type N-terminal cleavage/methylation domain-containing protein